MRAAESGGSRASILDEPLPAGWDPGEGGPCLDALFARGAFAVSGRGVRRPGAKDSLATQIEKGRDEIDPEARPGAFVANADHPPAKKGIRHADRPMAA